MEMSRMQELAKIDVGTDENKNHRALLGGFLVGYGFVNFLLIADLLSKWARFNPRSPDVANGFIYSYRIVFFSAFQARVGSLLFPCSFLLIIFGFVILPKIFRKRFAASPKLASSTKLGLIVGVITSPIAMYFFGARFIELTLSVWPFPS